MIVELRVNYPGSIWGKLRTLRHLFHDRHIFRTSKGERIMYDDTCRKAWWT